MFTASIIDEYWKNIWILIKFNISMKWFLNIWSINSQQWYTHSHKYILHKTQKNKPLNVHLSAVLQCMENRNFLLNRTEQTDEVFRHTCNHFNISLLFSSWNSFLSFAIIVEHLWNHLKETAIVLADNLF